MGNESQPDKHWFARYYYWVTIYCETEHERDEYRSQLADMGYDIMTGLAIGAPSAYTVTVVCTDEDHMREVHAELSQHYDCHMVTGYGGLA